MCSIRRICGNLFSPRYEVMTEKTRALHGTYIVYWNSAKIYDHPFTDNVKTNELFIPTEPVVTNCFWVYFLRTLPTSKPSALLTPV